ncbi:thyroid adenoma-associated protein homolog [Venturia canescens]|uniref:thyroid adenoma-associated protein homolog n=1 Tax=Venturia canescens TaxID=32260 RepID=UPI001C9CD4F0|nr:thyroid adenoma-associated protein homolog [Venturia canescens]
MYMMYTNDLIAGVHVHTFDFNTGLLIRNTRSVFLFSSTRASSYSRVLPIIRHSSPIFIHKMNEDDTLKFLKELRALKNAGDLDNRESLDNQETHWRNTLEFSLLTEYLKHHNDEIRLNTLALLVESKKSTEAFSKTDLTFVTLFLTYNLAERFEYVPLIKKALKRLKESLAVLRRCIVKEIKMRENESQVDTKHELYESLREEAAASARLAEAHVEDYREFLKSYRHICINGLLLGSTNYRKKSSLLMLQLGQDILDGEFPELPWTVHQATELLECLYTDTYEANKEIIYKIAKEINPSLMKLDDIDEVEKKIHVALNLADCMRPIDSITASYILKISLLSPVINQVLSKFSTSIGNIPDETVDRSTLKLILIVLEQLKAPLKLAETNIVAAAGKHSLYGYLFCIRNLLGICDLRKVIEQNFQVWQQTISEIIEISFRLNKTVSEIVNNSSPEGHFPMDMESNALSSIVPDANGMTTVTPQMVLLCSWRTVKEVSLLFGHLSSKSPITQDDSPNGLLHEKQLVEIGEHLVSLLFETKHRGAFEQAHVGFEQLCYRLWRSSHQILKQLPRIWLHHLLLAISGLTPGNPKLCATRRSAGIPFMVQALVSSDPSVQSCPASAVFHPTMKILLGFTDLEESTGISTTTTKSLLYEKTIFADLQDTDLNNSESPPDMSKRNYVTITEIKTHALNILRALFKHAQLGGLSRTYAADGLSAAIRSYDGKTWAERNAATLLFSSLITRIFGVQRTKDHVNLTLHNKMTGRIFFERYPSLLPFMLKHLRTFVDSSDTLIKPSVQSILLLLSRLYPSFNLDEADAKWKIDEFIQLVSACAKSKVYKTRELAARALVPLLTKRTVRSLTVELFEKIMPGKLSLNAMHGYMLQILEITKAPQFEMEDLTKSQVERFLKGTHWIIENLESDNDKCACFPLASAHVTALSELADLLDADEVKTIFHRLRPHLEHSDRLKQRPGREVYELVLAKFFINVMENRIFNEQYANGIAYNRRLTWIKLLRHTNVRVRIVAWTALPNLIAMDNDHQFIIGIIRMAIENMSENVDPELQNAIYDCFYEILTRLGNTDKPATALDADLVYSVTVMFMTPLVSYLDKNCYPESPHFLRLLGEIYGQLRPEPKAECLGTEEKRTIYKTFHDHSWMGSADTACRLAVSSVLYNLLPDPEDPCADDWLLLDWWTTLLNLLVDDNIQVRNNASQVLRKLNDPPTQLECISSMINHFFYTFSSYMANKQAVAFAALFTWATALSGDGDHQMDESDVFNKCYNYEIFEPLTITNLCVREFKHLLENYDENSGLPYDVKRWLSEKLFIAIEPREFACARLIIVRYKAAMHEVALQLEGITDPMYNDKMLQFITCKKFDSTLPPVQYPTGKEVTEDRVSYLIPWNDPTRPNSLERLHDPSWRYREVK